MYVCVCSAVTENQIRAAAATGAGSLRELRQSLGVAAQCGRCARSAHSVLKEAHACSGNCGNCDKKRHQHA
ncbi:MAG: bacterioferritin-associated ferredoxin [Rhodocyclales bacterium]|nr:bacterioferritin-associated ferredoxin [Rhodocyclales bacterium]